MIESLLPLLLLLAGFHLWQNALRARELARALGRELCNSARVQLLDQTVALQRLKLIWIPAHGPRVRRDYGFEFSTDGQDRQRGSLSMLGERLLAHNLPTPGPAIPARATVTLPGPSGGRR
jgi:Protein of unknown function (DUF3301)